MLPTAPSFSLNGKTALITGGGRGIGLAAAAALAQAGAAVTLVARSAMSSRTRRDSSTKKAVRAATSRST